MLFLRSTAFNVFFHLNISIWMLAASPLLLVSGDTLWSVVFAWSRLNLFALKWLAGIDVELRGLENLPATPCIIAAKHQSAFETVSLLHLFRRPAFILKKELMRIPLFGWYASKLVMVPVDRGGGQKTLRAMLDDARQVLNTGRQIIIFPEGTRVAPGSPPAYKYGIISLYKALGVPVVPVALNSGLHWPRRGFFRYPGKIVVEFLPPIAPGLDGTEFMDSLIGAIESKSDQLLLEAAV